MVVAVKEENIPPKQVEPYDPSLPMIEVLNLHHLPVFYQLYCFTFASNNFHVTYLSRLVIMHKGRVCRHKCVKEMFYKGGNGVLSQIVYSEKPNMLALPEISR